MERGLHNGWNDSRQSTLPGHRPYALPSLLFQFHCVHSIFSIPFLVFLIWIDQWLLCVCCTSYLRTFLSCWCSAALLRFFYPNICCVLRIANVVQYSQRVKPDLFEIRVCFCKRVDIDQLSRIMQLLGKPDKDFLAKITSEDVYPFCSYNLI